MGYPDIPAETTIPDDGLLPVPLPPGFPAAPAEASARLLVCGHDVEVVLRDTDDCRLLARMHALIAACCEGHEHAEEGEGEEKAKEVN